MGSSSAPRKPKEKMEIKSGNINTYDVDPFQVVAVNPNGRRKTFDYGGDMFIQSEDDDELYFKSTGGTKHANYIRLGAAEAPKAEGGGGKREEAAPVQQEAEIIYPGGEVIDTGPTGGYANWQDPMFNYQPITHGQHLNPLADPNNWVHTPDQQMGLLNNPGLFVNNPRPYIGVLS